MVISDKFYYSDKLQAYNVYSTYIREPVHTLNVWIEISCTTSIIYLHMHGS